MDRRQFIVSGVIVSWVIVTRIIVAALAFAGCFASSASSQDENYLDEPARYDRATLTVFRWDPSTPERVYAGTLGWGLVVSENSGRTWSATAPDLSGKFIQSIAVHPLVKDQVVVGTRQSGVWQSKDGGKTFERILEELEDDIPAVDMTLDVRSASEEARWRSYEQRMRFAGRVPDLSRRPKPQTIVWALQRRRGPAGGPDMAERDPVLVRMQPFHDLSAHSVEPDDLLVAGRGQVARTTDGGATWELVFSPLEAKELKGADPTSCYAVPFRFLRAASSPNKVWLTACHGLFASSDGGETWKLAPLADFGRVHYVAAHPTEPDYLAATTDGGVLRSRDGGENWELLRVASPDAPFRALAVLPNRDVLAGGHGGEVVRADEDGKVEVSQLRELQVTLRGGDGYAYRSRAPYDRSGLIARQEADPRLGAGVDLHVADLVFHPNLKDVVYAGTRRGVFRSDDGGKTWRHFSLGLGEMEVSDLAVDRSGALIDEPSPDPAGDRIVLWAATRGGGIYRSTSSGEAWQWMESPDDGVVRALLQDDRKPHVLWAGTADGGVYRSVDAGQTWHHSSRDLEEYGIRTLVKSGGALLAGTDNGEIWASFDDGSSWSRRGVLSRQAADESRDLETFENLGIRPGAMHVHDLLADPNDDDPLLAATTFGVFRSSDGGRTWTWTKLRRGVARLVRDPYDNETIFAGTTRGLWFTQDGGQTWRSVEFGDALKDLSLRGESDALASIREVPPIFAIARATNDEVLLGTDRGQVVRGSPERGGWTVARLAQPGWVPRPEGFQAPRGLSEAELTDQEWAGYGTLQKRRDDLLVASALANPSARRLSHPRHRALLAVEARRRGEVPTYPPALLAKLSPSRRAELLREDVATRVLRLASRDLATMQTGLVDGWGVENVVFGPLGRVLAVQSAVDDGRRTQTELRLYDLERRYLQPGDVYSRQGATQHWKVLHDVARKPQAARPDWLLENTGPLLLWRRGETLVTRPSDDRVAIWHLSSRPLAPVPATKLQPGSLRGFELPVVAVSISEDGKWLGAVDAGGQAYYALLAGGRNPKILRIPPAEGAERPPRFQQVHATSKQLLLLGETGIVAYRWGAEGPILERVEAGERVDAGEWLFGEGGGFSDVVADRLGRWMAAIPAQSEEAASTLVVVAFRDGVAAAVYPLDSATNERWSATVSAQQDWLAVRRASRDDSQSLLYEMRGDLAESGPSLLFRVEGGSELRFGAGEEHVAFTADGEQQVWSLEDPAPARLDETAPNLPGLWGNYQSDSPIKIAYHFFGRDPRMADLGEALPWERFPVTVTTSPDGRWLAAAGLGRLVRLWHFDDPKGTLEDTTGHLILDLARFRPYPSIFPSSLDVWPEIEWPAPPPGGADLWRQACSIAGRNFSEEEWRVLFGEEDWKRTCAF